MSDHELSEQETALLDGLESEPHEPEESELTPIELALKEIEASRGEGEPFPTEPEELDKLIDERLEADGDTVERDPAQGEIGEYGEFDLPEQDDRRIIPINRSAQLEIPDPAKKRRDMLADIGREIGSAISSVELRLKATGEHGQLLKKFADYTTQLDVDTELATVRENISSSLIRVKALERDLSHALEQLTEIERLKNQASEIESGDMV